MSAVAVRHPETEEETIALDSYESTEAAPLTTGPSRGDNVRWRDVAPYTERFAGAQVNEERARKRRLLKHRNFVLSVPFFACVLVFCEVVALLWVWSLDLKVTRHADDLDEQIKLVQLQISQADSKLAASASQPELQQWAAQYGYRKIALTDMDDVTGSTPPTATKPTTP